MAITATQNDGVSLNANKISYDLVETDVEIITSGRRSIPAHSGILASVSPVLTNIIEKPRKIHGGSSKKVIKILGVPCDAVSVFVRFLYSPSVTENEMEKYGIHLLALSHVYMVTQLKQRCTKGVGERVTAENVVDILQLARLCDAPDLCLKCMRFIHYKFKTVEQTEGWKFLQEHDPFLELDILQFIDDAESVSFGSISCRGRKEEGDTDENRILCKKRVDGKGCVRCKRMIQLLRLHSSICDQSESCRVPLCRQYKNRGEKDKKMVEDTKWKVLVRRVASAKAMSSLSQSKKKKSEVLFKEEAEDFIRIRNKLM
ncbi:unnamed protein product [Arabidopsis thaliana]|uniref:(thale cress) hypothetical protein n=1 Tax=Arabidopsis thaliana TaxID=3702 RepID=A0A7G2FJE2_ARATH|nr:unnamed protein product [Arabidopsis thaliana]